MTNLCCWVICNVECQYPHAQIDYCNLDTWGALMYFDYAGSLLKYLCLFNFHHLQNIYFKGHSQYVSNWNKCSQALIQILLCMNIRMRYLYCEHIMSKGNWIFQNIKIKLTKKQDQKLYLPPPWFYNMKNKMSW